VLAPLLYPSKPDLPMDKVNQDSSAMTNTMVSLHIYVWRSRTECSEICSFCFPFHQYFIYFLNFLCVLSHTSLPPNDHLLIVTHAESMQCIVCRYECCLVRFGLFQNSSHMHLQCCQCARVQPGIMMPMSTLVSFQLTGKVSCMADWLTDWFLRHIPQNPHCITGDSF
jgi:hypothetical protein